LTLVDILWYYLFKPFGVVFNNNNKYMSKTIQFFKEVIAELKNITWPTRNQTIFYTIIVIIVSLIVAYYLGLLDNIFKNGLNWILQKNNFPIDKEIF